MPVAAAVPPLIGRPAPKAAAKKVLVPETDGPVSAGSMVAHTKQYQVVELVGEGGMGWVYRAWDPVLERQVALKVMKPNVPDHERERFRREAIFGARFCHPSIARVYDLVGVPGQGISWFAMEYLPGKDLAGIIRRSREKQKPIPKRLVWDVFRQSLAALQYAHDCNVVHRDVKPENIFVTRDPNTRFVTSKLLDFGVALKADENKDEKKLVGDPRYFAPEQSRKGQAVDGRADLYAAGMCLYETITGRHPFEDLLEAPIHELFKAHRERTPFPLSNFLPTSTHVTVACGLDVVFEKACAKDPANRFGSAREMAAALADVLR